MPADNSRNSSREVRPWIGKYIAGIGILHTGFGLVLFHGVFGRLITDGLISSVYRQPERGFAFWFVATGLFWILLGALIDHYEGEGRPLPGFLGWALGAITVVGATINPMSGWWLFFVPTTALLYRSRNPR